MTSTIRFTGSPSGKLTVDLGRCGDLLSAIVPGMIRTRTDAGVDIDGKPLADYSPEWKETLVAMGEGTKVDLRLTGGLLNSIKRVKKAIANKMLTLTFAPGAGTSAEVAPPLAAKRAANERAMQRDTAMFGVARNRASMRRTGERGPQWNLLGLWIHRGHKGRPPRKFMGLSPDQRKDVLRQLFRTGIFKLGGHGTSGAL